MVAIPKRIPLQMAFESNKDLRARLNTIGNRRNQGLIVDFHMHIIPELDRIPYGFKSYMEREFGKGFEELCTKYRLPESVLNLLDESGIDYAVILAEVAPLTSPLVTNEDIINFARHNERFIPFCSINPMMDSNPAYQLERLVKYGGCRGLKLYPTYQYFYPNDSLLYPLYAKASELCIPVMFHTGSSKLPGARLKYGDPLYLDDVAVDFPNLTLVMCHSGRPFWYDEASFLARLHRNVYMEISGLPPKNLLTYFPRLEELSSKVLFGSDWYSVRSVKENIEKILELPISDSSRELILGGNAARILGLKE